VWFRFFHLAPKPGHPPYLAAIAFLDRCAEFIASLAPPCDCNRMNRRARLRSTEFDLDTHVGKPVDLRPPGQSSKASVAVTATGPGSSLA